MSNSHGHTTAAWTAVGIILIGCLISAVAMPLAWVWLFFVGLAVIVLGAVLGKVLSMMGLGNTVAYQDDRDPDYDHPSDDNRRAEPATG
jgi:multisubunit Na+/H+ antiporter MnhG subunit